MKTIEALGIPWDDCLIMSISCFSEHVATHESGSNAWRNDHKLKQTLSGVTIAKSGSVKLWVLDGKNETKHRRHNTNHVFLQSPIPGAYEFDIFDGKSGKGKWNTAQATLRDLKPSMAGWSLERLVVHAKGRNKKSLFIVFEDETDSLLFATAYQERILRK